MVVILAVTALVLRERDKGTLIATLGRIRDVLHSVDGDAINFRVEAVAAFPVLPGRDLQDLDLVVSADFLLLLGGVLFLLDSYNSYSFKNFLVVTDKIIH